MVNDPSNTNQRVLPLATRLETWLHHPLTTAGIVLLFLLLVLLTAGRTYRQYSVPVAEQFDMINRGLSDYHNGVYLPTQAFFDGVNPYSKDAVVPYRMARESSPNSPFLFAIHWPFSLLPMHFSDVVFFAYNLGLLVVLAWCSVFMSGGRVTIASVLGIACLLLLSRPGHITIFTGYFTLEMVIGTAVALHFARTHPWLSGVGILLASCKPTYIVPLTILMICRRNYLAVMIGVMLSAILAGGGLAWLAHDSSYAEVLSGIRQGQTAHHEDPDEYPVHAWTRVDVMGMIAKFANWNPDARIYLVAMLILFLIPGIIIYRTANQETNHGAAGLTAWIVILSILLGLYHHVYDCLLLVVPWVGVTFFGNTTLSELRSKSRWLVACLTGVPAVNYLSTLAARDLLGFDRLGLAWQIITTINGVCLFIALLILMRHAAQLQQSSVSRNACTPQGS